MEKDTELEELNPSVDIGHAVEEHLNLLESVDARQDLYEGRLLREAIRRYIMCWLPLVAEHVEGEKLLPPVDIEWVWYCHALSPLQYVKDVKEVVGKEVPYTWIFKSERSRSLDRAKSHWDKKFTNEPFQMKTYLTSNIPDSCESILALSQKLEVVVSRERNFYYQVSLPHHRKEKFIEVSVNRYKRFLALVKNLRLKIEVSSDVELIWRCHILYSESYAADCKSWFGSILDHNSSVETTSTPNDADSKQKTDSANEPVADRTSGFLTRHVLLRGESPRARLCDLSDEEKMYMSAKICQFSIEQIFLEGYKIDNKTSKVTTSVQLSGVNQRANNSKCLVEFHGCHFNPEERKPIKFTVDPQRYGSITFELTWKKTGSMLKTHKSAQGSHSFDLVPLIETCPNEGTTFSETASFAVKEETVRISARGFITPTDRGPIQLSHIPCSKDERLRLNNKELRIALQRVGFSPSELDDLKDVLVSTHRFINRSSRLIFTCKLHQKLPLLSLVHILARDEIVAEGHVVATDTLPQQVFPGIPCLGVGEIGFVIKNSHGDWGILVAGDGDDSEGAMRRGLYESYMKLYTITPVSKLWTMASFRLPGPDGSYVVEGSGYSIDLKTGSLSLQKSCPDVAEIVALAYGISTLQAMLWNSSSDHGKVVGKSKPGVRFASEYPRTWSDVARGNRFFNMIRQ